jgi:hypothetical protein
MKQKSLKDELMDEMTYHGDIQSIIKELVYENEKSADSGKIWHNPISEDSQRILKQIIKKSARLNR